MTDLAGFCCRQIISGGSAWFLHDWTGIRQGVVLRINIAAQPIKNRP